MVGGCPSLLSMINEINDSNIGVFIHTDVNGNLFLLTLIMFY